MDRLEALYYHDLVETMAENNENGSIFG